MPGRHEELTYYVTPKFLGALPAGNSTSHIHYRIRELSSAYLFRRTVYKMPVISFQAILDKALDDYREQIGVELDKHPFTAELQGRGSPDDILKLLETKANTFKAYRDGNRKLIKWLNPVVQVINTLSGVIGQAVSVSSIGLVGPLDILPVRIPGTIPTSTGDLRWG